MFELKIITDFAAAHQPKMVAQKCENLHGHNWRTEVFVEGERLNPAGVLVDFGILKAHVREIVGSLDHRFLNELEPFGPDGLAPSSENIAMYIAQRLVRRLDVPGVRVSRVTACESDVACATYIVAR